MTTPLRRACRGVADLPSLQEIRQLIDDDHHLVLHIDSSSGSPDFDEAHVIDLLAPELLDYTVFDSGGAVTILKVIAEMDVLAAADAIVAAAAVFRLTATGLMDRLSKKLHIPVQAFYGLEYRPLLDRGWFRDRWKGRLDSHWRYGFHGRQCGFRQGVRGQEVQVEMGFWEEFGVLDPFFLAKFVATTPSHRGVAVLFRDNFHDPRRALMILERLGRLKRITDRVTGRQGLVAPEP